jgi:hypothetical protein
MSLEKQWRMVQQLAKRTDGGTVDWRTTSEANAFQVSFKNYTLILREEPSGREEPDYEITLLNEVGEPADRFGDNALYEEFGDDISDKAQLPYNLMRKLFADARRKATGADKILDTILDDLNDIPF